MQNWFGLHLSHLTRRLWKNYKVRDTLGTVMLIRVGVKENVLHEHKIM